MEIEESNNLGEVAQGEVAQGDASKIKSCLSIVRTLPISKYKKTVDGITNLIYDDDELLNEFLQKIDQPAEICKLDKNGEFLTCEFNRDGDSYRSPISNLYIPVPEDSDQLRLPSPKLRDMEISMNKIFREYAKLYYGNSSICSSYCWELNSNIDQGFCVAVVIKNIIDAQKGIRGGCWDSSNLVVIKFNETDSGLEALYRLTSTVFFSASLLEKEAGSIEFSGSVTRLVESSKIVHSHFDIQGHISNIGEMIESSEGELRNRIEERNIKKTKEILDTARFSPVIGKPNIEGAQKLKEVFSKNNQA